MSIDNTSTPFSLASLIFKSGEAINQNAPPTTPEKNSVDRKQSNELLASHRYAESPTPSSKGKVINNNTSLSTVYEAPEEERLPQSTPNKDNSKNKPEPKRTPTQKTSNEDMSGFLFSDEAITPVKMHIVKRKGEPYMMTNTSTKNFSTPKKPSTPNNPSTPKGKISPSTPKGKIAPSTNLGQLTFNPILTTQSLQRQWWDVFYAEPMKPCTPWLVPVPATHDEHTVATLLHPNLVNETNLKKMLSALGGMSSTNMTFTQRAELLYQLFHRWKWFAATLLCVEFPPPFIRHCIINQQQLNFQLLPDCSTTILSLEQAFPWDRYMRYLSPPAQRVLLHAEHTHPWIQAFRFYMAAQSPKWALAWELPTPSQWVREDDWIEWTSRRRTKVRVEGSPTGQFYSSWRQFPFLLPHLYLNGEWYIYHPGAFLGWSRSNNDWPPAFQPLQQYLQRFTTLPPRYLVGWCQWPNPLQIHLPSGFDPLPPSVYFPCIAPFSQVNEPPLHHHPHDENVENTAIDHLYLFYTAPCKFVAQN